MNTHSQLSPRVRLSTPRRFTRRDSLRRSGGFPPGGFTLIEMLVVMGIITLLLSILAPVVFRMRRTGERSRTALDMNSISTALEAFKSDVGDYPRASTYPSNTTYGPEILGACLISAADRTTTMSGAGGGGMVMYADNQQGPGFRMRPMGQIYGPYLRPDKFAIAAGSDIMTDRNGSPILYFPARIPTQDPTIPFGFVDDRVENKTTNPPTIDPNHDPMYDHRQAQQTTTDKTGKTTVVSEVLPISHMRFMLGDQNMNGQIDRTSPAESPAYVGNYVLWLAGPDKKFGMDLDFTVGPSSYPGQLSQLRNAASKCDDVTNFRP